MCLFLDNKDHIIIIIIKGESRGNEGVPGVCDVVESMSYLTVKRGMTQQHHCYSYSQARQTTHAALYFRGTYKMERRDGTSFDCKIPPFSLESKTDENNPNNTFLGN